MQLSRHLDVRLSGSNIVLTNLYFGTSLEFTAEQFAELPGGSRQAEAFSQHILVPDGAYTPEWPGRPGLALAVQAYISRERPFSVAFSDLSSSLRLLRHTLETYLISQEESPRMAEMMFSSLGCLLELEPGSPQGGLSPELCLKSLGRPLDARLELEQLPSTLYTAQARAEVAGRFGGGTLLLGDDDLVSLAAATSVHVLELDQRIVHFLRGRGVSIALHDLMQGLPAQDIGVYQTVVADPPYSAKDFAAFMRCAHDALMRGGHFLLSTNLAHLETPVSLESWGFEVVQTERAFNRYPYPRRAASSLHREGRPLRFPAGFSRSGPRPPVVLCRPFCPSQAGVSFHRGGRSLGQRRRNPLRVESRRNRYLPC